MLTIIDHIRLKHPDHRAAFVKWVREVDYAACRDLPSVLRFEMHEAAGNAEFDFFEIILVSSREAFERDMKLPLFDRLQARFSEMASVVRQIAGAPVPPGYVRRA